MKVHTKTTTTYIANDGKSFDTPEECKLYERSILPFYKQLAIRCELMYADGSDMYSCYNEYDDLSGVLEDYTHNVIQKVLEHYERGDTHDEIRAALGLDY